MASSPRPATLSIYEQLNTGLDHALAFFLRDDEAVPAALRLDAPRTRTPFEEWRAVRVIAAERRVGLIEKEARRQAKRKLKRKESAERAAAEEGKAESIKVKGKRDEGRKKEKAKTEAAPVVKMLDLSGANLSPVMTHAKAPPRVNLGALSPLNAPHTSTVVEKTTPLAAESPKLDLLTRLRRLPLLEDVAPTTTKYTKIVKWLEHDDGKNQSMNASLSSMINKLQKNGVAGGNGKASPKRQLHLGSETLDDRLKKERQLEKKNRKTAKNGVKTERKRRKAEETTAARGRKRKLGGFVVDSDEEEYEDGAWEHDSEAEYQSGDDASSSADECDFEVEVNPKNVDVVVKTEPSENARSSSAAPPRSTLQASHASVESDQLSLTGKERLAIVAAKLRKLEEEETSVSTPTYLSYDRAPASKSVKQEVGAAAASTPNGKSFVGVDGTSESNAIVLDDSDEEDDDTQELVIQPHAPPPAAASSTPQPKQERAPPPKQPKQTKKPSGKGKAAASTPAKRKNKVESDDDDSDAGAEAEFVVPGEEDDSSTDADDDMFDLNEEDVYVVESILEVKKGRTLMTNSGRYTKDPDLFLVKWEGYDELTWEPESNIPKRIINLFNDRELAKKNCNYQIDKFAQRKVAKNSTTGKDEILYLIQWKGLPQAYWEVKTTLPQKVIIWLEKTSRASVGKNGLAGPSSRKKAKK